MDVRKAEINEMQNDITTSVSGSCDRLNQKTEDSSQSLMWSVDRLYNRIADFDVRLTTLEQSLDGIPLDLVGRRDKMGAFTK